MCKCLILLFMITSCYFGIDGQIICSENEKYRSYDGTCNNIEISDLGSANTPFSRFLSPSYCDGVKTLPCAKSGNPLPGPREISLKIYKDVEKIDPEITELAVGWGQSVAHDMSLLKSSTYNNPVPCCKNGNYTISQTTNPQCAAIPIPEDDPYNGPAGNECYNFRRTSTGVLPQKPIELLTVVTHYMDLSITYGNSATEALGLRSTYGTLKSEKRNGAEWLPQSLVPSSDCNNYTIGQPCYRAGDSRVNQNTGLTYMQTLFMREHNRIAAELCDSIFCLFNSRVCYQEARRILIAIYQHITYYEYLTLILGEEHMIEKKLIYPNATGYINDYNNNVDPTVAVEHATAAFRNQHSSIPGQFELYSEDLQEVDQTLELSAFMNRPFIIEQGDNAQGLSRCLFAQHQMAVDRFYDFEVTNLLFRNGAPLGQDLRSLDIQRSRDHGVGTYCNALRAIGTSECNSFDDLRTLMSDEHVDLLEALYEDVEDIELTVGGGLEPNEPGTTAGKTFRAISTLQFLNTRTGDKYFYENGEQPVPFTLDQLNSIRTATAAMIICNSGDDVDEITRNAFAVISKHNPTVPCSEIPQVDLSLFKPYAACIFA